MPDALTAVSLFSGGGGLDIGLHAAGFHVASFAENNLQAQQILRHHHPSTPILQDVHDVTPQTLLDHGVTQADLIHGGFPCQDVSVAGNRAGLAGGRSGLWWEFHRILSECTPRWCVIENVVGLLSSNRGRDLGAVLGALGDLGYGFAWRVLDAQNFGVPQRRRRVFIVGHLGADRRRAAEVLLVGEGRARNPQSRGQAGKAFGTLTVQSIGGSGGVDVSSAQAGHIVAASRAEEGDIPGIPDLANTLTARDAKGPPTYIDAGAGNLIPMSLSQNQRGEVRVSDVAPALGVSGGIPGQGYSAVVHLTQDPISSTNTSPCIGTGKPTGAATIGVAEGLTVRKLTPRECERLMGWPDDWTRWGMTEAGDVVEIADSHRYRVIGNGVASPCGEWLGRRILEVDAT